MHYFPFGNICKYHHRSWTNSQSDSIFYPFPWLCFHFWDVEGGCCWCNLCFVGQYRYIIYQQFIFALLEFLSLGMGIPNMLFSHTAVHCSLGGDCFWSSYFVQEPWNLKYITWVSLWLKARGCQPWTHMFWVLWGALKSTMVIFSLQIWNIHL